LVFVHQQMPHVTELVIRSKLGALAAAGEAMDFAVRLRAYQGLTPAVAAEFAAQTGIPSYRLISEVLPRLKNADLVDFDVDRLSGQLKRIEEYVGLSGRIIDQAMKVVEAYGPSDVERAVLHSSEVASWAPLTYRQHVDQLTKRGFSEQIATETVQLSLAAGINKKMHSAELNDDVVYNPNVWGAEHTSIAGFLRTLPPAERDSLLGMCEQASTRPGLALSSYGGFSPPVLESARRVGLLQAAKVKSSRVGASEQSYLFSPLLESEDDRLLTTEALHQRKMFVAHILYGHEKAVRSGGRILDPTVLVRKLLLTGTVGSASNISTDYHLLEAQGIVAVRPDKYNPGRSYLELVKEEIVAGGLGWLEAAHASDEGPGATFADLRPPSGWRSPEADRASLGDRGAADEITQAAVLRLRSAREEAQRAARFEF
jgi:hypothetical protein